MARIVGLIDFGSMGNIESIRNAQSCRRQCQDNTDAKDFKGVERYVPGVVSFLKSKDTLKQTLRAYSRCREDTLHGICLCMQILATVGYEFGETDGLGLIDGEVRLMQCRPPCLYGLAVSSRFVVSSVLWYQ